MQDQKLTLQDAFLAFLNQNRTPSTVFLLNGVKLQGFVTGFDAFSLLLQRDGHVQLVYKHAVSTIMPNDPIPFFEGDVPDSRS